MKIALLSDIHNNLPRLEAALKITKAHKIKSAICLGDVANHETLNKIAENFENVYLALGNMDHTLARQPSMIPENVQFFTEKGGAIKLGGQKIFIVHNDFLARVAAESGQYDLVFYGHTHTPWEKKIGLTTLLNPGEIAGQFGLASFAIYDLKKVKAQLFTVS